MNVEATAQPPKRMQRREESVSMQIDQQRKKRVDEVGTTSKLVDEWWWSGASRLQGALNFNLCVSGEVQTGQASTQGTLERMSETVWVASHFLLSDHLLQDIRSEM